ncbi:MAG: LON peptidase substrate-binding domain-containing protein [Planctomycetota bacterium]|jgi:Lon protease-like protein
MGEAIRVDFRKPVPLFPLPSAVLLPYAIQPLHIFEPRYRQMVNDSLDQAGQIAMASFVRDEDTSEQQTPPLRPVVCIGQIIHHESMPDGRHNILLHGVCRARITKLFEPDDERLYRLATLAPLEPVDQEPPPLPNVRSRLRRLLSGPRLSRMRCVDTVMEWFEREDVTTHALLELVGFILVQDPEVRYALLAEPSPTRRAGMIQASLSELDRIILRADRQSHGEWPDNVSWN